MEDGEHFCNICGGPLSTNFIQHSSYDPCLTTAKDTEWLVTNPDYEPDFSNLLEEARRDGPEEIDAKLWDEAKDYEYVDRFWRFPVELRHKILHLLPSESLFDVLRASPAFCMASTALPNKYWYSVIEDRMPWMEHTTLIKILTETEDPIDYKSLAARLIEVTTTSDDRNGPWDEYLGLQNRRRIMMCIDRILDDIEDSVASQDNYEGVSTQILGLSSFRAVTFLCDASIAKKNTDIYIRPVIDNPPSVTNVKVYFGAHGGMVGIEFLLEGDKSGRLVGHQTNWLQIVSFRKDVVINGFVISLGPMREFHTNHMIHGLAILTDGNYHHPYARFGHWTNNDIVHILCARTTETLVGLSAQYTVRSSGFVWDMEGDLLATTRWTGNWPSPDNEPARLMPSLKQLNIRRTQTAVQFLDFRSRVIDCITAFFPFGKGKAIGGLLFKFSDGTRQLVGKAKNDRSISRFACNVITFNPGNEQRIAGVAIYCTDKRLGSPEPCGFITEPRWKNMVLGYRRFQSPGGYELKGPYEYYDKERITVGMQFVIEQGVITQLGLMH
ncbi:unnamed protein product [Aspergillus oryzae]|uniref:Unnamed protein product n=1 Tax=Aspergillus oryzae TaxID=5062 RepID=A0AAN4YFC5_ASPOZ|nr:unnamed protein product [Aspergillus oryzae]GMF92577.1 unnamed protein product [Aspergillus oryzae]GMG28946.1 unnamed protein product [Aspergillus oryzae]